MRNRILLATSFLSLVATVAFPARRAYANTDIHLETVSDYSFLTGNHNQDTDADTEGQGFWNAMTASGTPWTAGVWYKDASVWDSDFEDPEVTGNTRDDDTFNFDTYSTGLSYFIGHGQCNDALQNWSCTDDQKCKDVSGDPNAYCPQFPLQSGQVSNCIEQSSRSLITSSSSSIHGNYVNYGSGSYPQAWGEDSSSGGWDGAGTNGGTNIVMITNSCGFRSHFLTDEFTRSFAGVHMAMVEMPVGNIHNSSINGTPNFSDVIQYTSRGADIANLILTNTARAASVAWLATSFANEQFSGAGATLVASFDSSWQAAETRIDNETWQQTTSEAHDVTASGGGYYEWTCNFSNCSSYSL